MIALTVPLTHFQIPSQIAVKGLITGLTYALLAVGLALVYRSSRVINFAHGETGALAAKTMVFLILNQHTSYWVGLIAGLAVAAAAGAVIELVVMRKLADSS